MTKLDTVERTKQEHGNAVAETLLERSVGIDVEFGQARAGGFGKRHERRAHVIAQMAICADEERELDQIGEERWKLKSNSGERANARSDRAEYAKARSEARDSTYRYSEGGARGALSRRTLTGSEATVKRSGVRSTPR